MGSRSPSPHPTPAPTPTTPTTTSSTSNTAPVPVEVLLLVVHQRHGAQAPREAAAEHHLPRNPVCRLQVRRARGRDAGVAEDQALRAAPRHGDHHLGLHVPAGDDAGLERLLEGKKVGVAGGQPAGADRDLAAGEEGEGARG